MSNIFQFEAGIPQDYSYSALKKMADIMEIKFDEEKFLSAAKNEDFNDPGCICILRDDKNKDRLVMLDTFGSSTVYTILARCMESEQKYIKKGLLIVINEILEDYEEDLLEDLENTINHPDNGFDMAMKRCNTELL